MLYSNMALQVLVCRCVRICENPVGVLTTTGCPYSQGIWRCLACGIVKLLVLCVGYKVTQLDIQLAHPLADETKAAKELVFTISQEWLEQQL